MQPLLLLGLGAPQLGAQHLAEERVEPEPLVAAVERGEEHVRARELAQLRRRAAALEDRVAEIAAQPVEDRGAAEEVELAAADRLEEFFPDVVDDEAVVAGEAVDRLAGLGRVAQRQPGQVEGRGPALGPPHQRLQLVGGDAQAERPQQLVAFPLGHHQVAGAELVDPAVGPQAADRQLGLGAGGEDQLGPRRQVGGERRHHLERRGVLDPLEVVEHEDERDLPPLQRPPEAGQHDVLEVRLEVGERGADLGRDRLDRVERGDDRADQHRRVVVGVAEDQGRVGTRIALGPLRDQHRLPVARRGVQQDHRRRGPFEPGQQARTLDQTIRVTRHPPS